MLAVNYSTIRENLKSYCDRVTDENETVIVTRKDEKNVVIISLDEWNETQKALRNAEYLAKIEQGIKGIKAGRGITKSSKELESTEDIADTQFRHRSLKERAEEFGGKIGPYEEPDYSDEVGREIWGSEYFTR